MVDHPQGTAPAVNARPGSPPLQPILEPGQLFDEWHRRFHHLKRAHFRAAWWYEKRNRRYGRATIVLSTAAAPLTFVLAKSGLDGQFYWVAVVSVVAALAGLLATLQIFDRDSERAERHRVAGGIYAKLEGDVEETCAFLPASSEALQIRAQQFRDEWHRLTGSSPVIPEFIFKEVEGEIEQRPAFNILSRPALDARTAAAAGQPPVAG